jgi:hypothetical protein
VPPLHSGPSLKIAKGQPQPDLKTKIFSILDEIIEINEAIILRNDRGLTEGTLEGLRSYIYQKGQIWRKRTYRESGRRIKRKNSYLNV